MTFGTRMWQLSGSVIETTPGRAAYMVWEGPGHKDSAWLPLRSPILMYRYLRAAPRGDITRAQDWVERWEKRRQELVPEPHWYAQVLGVDPDRQRFGLGAVLTRHGVARADAGGFPAFLEADTESNRRFYEKFGFEVIENGLDDVRGISVWRMRRRPR